VPNVSLPSDRWIHVAATLVCILLMGQPAVMQTMAQTRPLTVSVLGTFLMRNGEMELVVLWRGSPGWHIKSKQLRSSGNTNTYRLSIGYDDITLILAFDRARRTATINEVEVAVPRPRNVIMVDGIGGDKLVQKTAAVDLSISGNPDVASLLSRSPEVVAFLRCDEITTHPLQAQIDSLVCDSLK